VSVQVSNADLLANQVHQLHALDPLSGSEIRAAAALVRADRVFTDSTYFVTITLAEPAKPAGLNFTAGDQVDRSAEIVLYDPATATLSEVLVSLDRAAVLSTVVVPDRFPLFIRDEMMLIEAAVRADARWQAAMRARGIADPDLAMIDAWPSGYYGPQDHPSVSARLCRPLTWLRSSELDHGYARPVEGLVVTLDLDAMRVIDVEDAGVVAVPAHPGNYSPELMFDPENRPAFSQLRDDLKPIEISQPAGPSFTVQGWAINWQKWSLRVGFNPREGLVLHQLGYTDAGRLRPIMYRAALSEMVVPYGDPSATQWNKNVFDMGEVGMGFTANSLTLGCDCLGEIHYFDGVVNGSDGEPISIPNAICLHEEDFGIGWKHTDTRTNLVEVRRSRRLVISSIATVGNYEYGFYWYLYTDGSIEYEVKLTGVLTTGAVEVGERPRWGELVAPGLYGPNHQHFFNVRMDMCIDGANNSVYEMDSVVEPEPERNPHHNAWIDRPTLVTSEREGARDFNFQTARYWQICNPGVINELGNPVAYKLVPGAGVPPMFQQGSAIYDRARFAQHALWVTRYEPNERYAAGNYPYQCPDAQGLPDYVNDDASTVDSDLVLWYTVGSHHVVRPEDWPVMPVAYAGFRLLPVGFFDGNPALDMPRSAVACANCQGTCHGGHSPSAVVPAAPTGAA
jgi:primary-amine oxidase